MRVGRIDLMLRRVTLSLFVAVVALGAVPLRAQINTEQVLRIGRNALSFEDYVLSIQYFNQVIKAKPYLPEPYFYRAVAKISLEDYTGAEEDATLCIERNPFITDAYQVRGVARQNLGKYQLAADDYEHGLQLMPEDRHFLLNKAVCELQLKQFDLSRQSFDELLRHDPKNDRAYLGLAQLALEQADTVAALEHINHSIEIAKSDLDARLMRADVLMKQGKYEEALPDIDRAIELQPNNAGYFINRAYMRYHSDDYFGAMADYDYAVALQPDSPEAHFNRGLLLAEVGESNKAIDDFTFVLAHDPDNFFAIYNRAMLYFNTGQYRKAVGDFDKVLEKYPKFEAGFMMRGETKRRMGDRAGGDRDYNRAIAIFDSKHTRHSDFNPLEIEAEERKQEQQRKAEALEAEDQDAIMERFDQLMTVNTVETALEPEYENRTRGHVQNADVVIDPEPLFTLSYYAPINELNGTTHYQREVTDLNDTRLLGKTLFVTNHAVQLAPEQIAEHFSSIEYYDGLLATNEPRAVDYFARALDFLMVKNPDAALQDVERAITRSPDFTVAYLLRASVRLLKYQMLVAGTDQSPTVSPDAAAEAMLREREAQTMLAELHADFDEVLRRSPKSVYAHYDKGCVFQLQANYTAAISCYNEAIGLKPDFAEAYYNRGLAYLRLGNKERGIADLSQAGELGILPSYNVIKRMNSR